jgi:hypothetical protein
LLTSDSLNATVIVSLCVLTISANELEEDEEPVEPVEPVEPEPPRLPAVVPVPPVADELDDELLLALLDELDPPLTESPG